MQAATRKLHQELVALVKGSDGVLQDATVETTALRRGGLYRLDDDRAGEPFATILSRANRDQIEAEASAPMPIEMRKYSMGSYGAQFCEVRVSALTGETRVSRFLGSFDAGQILNPKMATSQFKGGIIMGIGLALTEETYFDKRTGRIVNASLADYHVPVQMDVPPIEILYTNKPDPQAPMGARGIGEIGITGVGAAVANAVYNATGIRVRDLPVTLDKLMAGLD